VRILWEFFFPSLKSTKISIFQEKDSNLYILKNCKKKKDSKNCLFSFNLFFDVASITSILKTIRVAHY